MINQFKYLAAAAALAGLAVPAFAQDEPEEARTTYQVTFVKLNPGADERWTEIMDAHFAKARKAAGLPAPQVHWLTTGAWDLMIVTQVPGGMATLDSHNPPGRLAYEKAILAQEGTEEAVTALNKEMDGLVGDSERFFTHTHP